MSDGDFSKQLEGARGDSAGFNWGKKNQQKTHKQKYSVKLYKKCCFPWQHLPSKTIEKNWDRPRACIGFHYAALTARIKINGRGRGEQAPPSPVAKASVLATSDLSVILNFREMPGIEGWVNLTWVRPAPKQRGWCVLVGDEIARSKRKDTSPLVLKAMPPFIISSFGAKPHLTLTTKP